MKKLIVFLILIILLNGCSSNIQKEDAVSTKVDNVRIEQEASESDQISKLEQEVTDLKTQVNELQNLLNQVTAERDSLQAQLDSIQAESKVQDDDVTVLVTDKINIPENPDEWRFSDSVTFKFSVKNNTDKDIQGVQGILTIKDLFGVNISKVKCDFTGQTIKAGQTVVVDNLGIEINPFIDSEVKIYNTDYRDLKFSYEVSKIVFEDGSIKEK